MLLAKFRAYSMGAKATELMHGYSYLLGRKQRVKISGPYSEWLSVSKGVPQGSIFGLMMFNIFTNNVYTYFKKSELYNYAYDNTLSVIGYSISTVISTLSCKAMTTVEWFSEKLMEASPEKFL